MNIFKATKKAENTKSMTELFAETQVSVNDEKTAKRIMEWLGEDKEVIVFEKILKEVGFEMPVTVVPIVNCRLEISGRIVSIVKPGVPTLCFKDPQISIISDNVEIRYSIHYQDDTVLVKFETITKALEKGKWFTKTMNTPNNWMERIGYTITDKNIEISVELNEYMDDNISCEIDEFFENLDLMSATFKSIYEFLKNKITFSEEHSISIAKYSKMYCDENVIYKAIIQNGRCICYEAPNVRIDSNGWSYESDNIKVKEKLTCDGKSSIEIEGDSETVFERYCLLQNYISETKRRMEVLDI